MLSPNCILVSNEDSCTVIITMNYLGRFRHFIAKHMLRKATANSQAVDYVRPQMARVKYLVKQLISLKLTEPERS